jgi:hypothetical protein
MFSIMSSVLLLTILTNVATSAITIGQRGFKIPAPATLISEIPGSGICDLEIEYCMQVRMSNENERVEWIVE